MTEPEQKPEPVKLEIQNLKIEVKQVPVSPAKEKQDGQDSK